jgi:hypothetical protein
MTTTNTFTPWPALLPESTLTVHSAPTRRSRSGLIKRLDTPAPPDEITVQKLNELATKHPFCTPYKVKKHDML